MRISSKQQAERALFRLVEFVLKNQNGISIGMSYQKLAGKIGRIDQNGHPQAHGMGQVLGHMRNLLKELENRMGQWIPMIQSLVVNKSGILKGLPDKGIEEFWEDYSSLSRAEK